MVLENNKNNWTELQLVSLLFIYIYDFMCTLSQYNIGNGYWNRYPERD